jgi:H+/gluconate symporter-like permease
MNILRKIFLALFIISTLVVLGLALNLNRGASINPSSTNEPSDTPGTPETIHPGTEPTAPAAQNSGALIGSVIASATTLIGFIVTTLISWRKEKRESALADMQYKKLETELEKSRLELEKLKKSGSKKKTKK